MRRHRGVGGLAKEFNLTRVLDHAQGSEERLHVARIDGEVAVLEPVKRELGIRALIDQDHAAKRRNDGGKFVAQRVDGHHTIKTGFAGVGIGGPDLGPGPALGGAIARRQQQDLGISARLHGRGTSGRQVGIHLLEGVSVERGYDQDGGAGLVDAGEVPEILVLAKTGERFGEVAFGGGEDDDGRAIRLPGQGLAAGAIGLVGLAIEGEGGGGEEQEENQEAFQISDLVRWW